MFEPFFRTRDGLLFFFAYLFVLKWGGGQRAVNRMECHRRYLTASGDAKS